MPEEKVSTCPSCGYTKQDAQFHGDHRLCKNAGNAPWEKKISHAPAADAGPRQPHAIVIHKIPHCVCGHAHDAGNICSRCACRVAKLCNCALAAPPVPQEAAPLIVTVAPGTPDLEGLNDALIAENKRRATVPDSAMRVAEESINEEIQHLQWEFRSLETVSDEVFEKLLRPSFERVAALIREAGSERERELTTALRNLLRANGTKLYIAAYAEASRLLGGESK